MSKKKLTDDLTKACTIGSLFDVQRTLSEGARFNPHCLGKACYGGHIDIVKFWSLSSLNKYEKKAYLYLVKQSYEGFTFSVRKNRYLYDIYKKTYSDIIKILMSEGSLHSYDLDLYNACREGFFEAVKLILSLGASDYEGGLIGAYYNGSPKMVHLMISLGAKNYVGVLVRFTSKDSEEINKMISSKMSREELYACYKEIKQYYWTPRKQHILCLEFDKKTRYIKEILLEIFSLDLAKYIFDSYLKIT